MMTKLPSLLTYCLSVHSDDGQALAQEILRKHFHPSAITVGRDFTYAEGTVPILLVAHTDTVHNDSPDLYFDPARQTVWSPNGLGADDRAGVYAIAALLAMGHRPHVLYTDGEERGGIGAKDARDNLDPPDVRCMVQLDRAHGNDAVYYSCRSRKMRRWVNRFGFRTAQGTYTDIATLMPAWGLAGVNLSVGYYGQHSESEILRVDELENTILRVSAMLLDPPSKVIRYNPPPTRSSALPFWHTSERDDAYCYRNIHADNPLEQETAQEEYDRLLKEHVETERDLENWEWTDRAIRQDDKRTWSNDVPN